MFLEWEQLQKLLISLLGILVLVSGTRFYKFLVILPGVGAGVYLGAILSFGQVEEVQLFSMVLLGVLGIVGSLLLEKFAIALLGALLGGAVVQYLLPIFWTQRLEWYWATAGAVLGGMVIYPIFPTLLPLLSSIVGAYCLSWALERPTDYVLIGALTIFGFFVQRLFGAKKPNLEE